MNNNNVYATSFDNQLGENINEIWKETNPKCVINENFGSVQIKPPIQQQTPIQCQQQPPIQQQIKYQPPIQCQSYIPYQNYVPKRNIPNIEKFSSEKFDAKEPKNLAMLITCMLFTFVSWLIICGLIYNSFKEISGKCVLGFYILLGLGMIITIIVKYIN